MVLDVRFLPNPYWEEDMREKTGLEREVAAYVLDNDTGRAFLQRLTPLLLFVADRFQDGTRKEFRLAIGCTGGCHRSVATVEAVRSLLDRSGFRLNVFHRDIGKK